MTDRTGEGQLDRASFYAQLPVWLSGALPEYLPQRRWFGDKARQIDSVTVAEVVPIDSVSQPAAMAIVNVHFSTGEPAQYVLPVVYSTDSSESPEETIVILESGALVDGLSDHTIRAWFIFTIAGGEASSSESLIADWDSGTAEVPLTDITESQLLGVEQSNTSILYGSHTLIKVFRRLQPGNNPDVELTRFLTTKTSFAHMPRYLGSLTHQSFGGVTSVIASAQTFVENRGDGWSFLLETIKGHLADQNGVELISRSSRIARELGVVTAEMHLALASDSWTIAVAPEPIKRGDAERWSAQYLASIDRVTSALLDRFDRLDQNTKNLASLFLEGTPGLRKRNGGFFRLIGRSKIRVHGDYHLGQTLRTLNNGFVIIDFEGEPQRSIEERRQKTSPLKDVAGMLRSFGYARGTATAWLNESMHLTPADLIACEREMRDVFLSAYVETARKGGAAFLPGSNEELLEALTAWELDKAAYEVLYEINNRPDWLWNPLSSMLKQGEPEG